MPPANVLLLCCLKTLEDYCMFCSLPRWNISISEISYLLPSAASNIQRSLLKNYLKMTPVLSNESLSSSAVSEHSKQPSKRYMFFFLPWNIAIPFKILLLCRCSWKLTSQRWISIFGSLQSQIFKVIDSERMFCFGEATSKWERKVYVLLIYSFASYIRVRAFYLLQSQRAPKFKIGPSSDIFCFCPEILKDVREHVMFCSFAPPLLIWAWNSYISSSVSPSETKHRNGLRFSSMLSQIIEVQSDVLFLSFCLSAI
jgi:hypothetical protein